MQSNKNKILPGNCSKGRDKWYVLAKLYKNNIADKNILQPIKIVVKLWKVWTISQPFYFLLWHWPSNFLPCWVCVDLVTMPCCLQAPPQWCWGFKPPGLWLLVIFSLFFLSNWTTRTQEMHMILNQKQKGDGLIIEEEKLVLQPYYYQLTKLSLSSPLSLFWHLQMSVWNFTPITNILISYILDWREKSQSLLIQLLSIRYFKTGQIISLEICYHKILIKL